MSESFGRNLADKFMIMGSLCRLRSILISVLVFLKTRPAQEWLQRRRSLGGFGFPSGRVCGPCVTVDSQRTLAARCQTLPGHELRGLHGAQVVAVAPQHVVLHKCLSRQLQSRRPKLPLLDNERNLALRR